jgi:hypothetical protein
VRRGGRVSYAAVILAHRSPAQVERLVDRLGCPCWVHYDAKAATSERRRLERSPHLELVPNPVDVAWGHWSIVSAILKGLAAVQGDPDHVLVLSGQTYPIKPRHVVADRLGRSVSFLECEPLPYPSWAGGGFDRIERPWLRLPRFMPGPAMVPIPIRRRLPEVQFFGGSAWFVLHRDARQVLLDEARRGDLSRLFRRAKLPDELFVHTVLANSPVSEQLVNDDLHFIKWVEGPNPTLIGEQDWENLVRSDALFARKFEPEERVLDRIDAELLV